MSALLTVARLTIHEAARKRVLLAALVLGLAFVGLDAVGLHFIVRGFAGQTDPLGVARARFTYAFFTLAGLYAVNFLTALSGVLLPIDTLSGEIASGVMQTVAAKPVRRSDIVLGKWAAYATVTVLYLLLLAGGVLLVARLVADYVPPDVPVGLGLLAIEAVALVTLSITGGTRLATVTNGMLAFGLYGLALIGGWVEQIGAHVHNTAARDVGAVASLIMPSESMWQLAAHHMQPPLFAQIQGTPFSPASVPSTAMVLWAAGWTLAVLALGLRSFARRVL
ncbi:MAG TPA: ABC transporter permease subunit [Candidatus Acidoferrales bacterium]|nr:ABC transporter permease subunit [Candidatus Acidoferrales bacterium]